MFAPPLARGKAGRRDHRGFIACCEACCCEERPRREANPYLPDGHYLEDVTDADFLPHLRRPDGSVVATFSPIAVDPLAIEAVAWEDRRGREG